MPLEIKDRHDLTIVPLHILRNPALSFELKGVATMLYSFDGFHGTTNELATILGVSEPQAIAYAQTTDCLKQRLASRVSANFECFSKMHFC